MIHWPDSNAGGRYEGLSGQPVTELEMGAAQSGSLRKEARGYCGRKGYQPQSCVARIIASGAGGLYLLAP
jgi:hypothetical protein